jgi:hypothetical protein
LDHRGVMLRQPLVIANGAAASVDPGERPLDCLPAVQNDEGGLAGQFGDDVHVRRSWVAAQSTSLPA